MNKMIAVAGLAAVSLWAADFWRSKPFTEWSDKDVQKMLTASPWARQVSVTADNPAAGRMGGGRGQDLGDATSTPRPPSGSGIPGVDAGGGGFGGGDPSPGGGRSAGGLTPEDIGGPSQSVMVMVRWQSALPMKQAALRARYGSEVATAPEAKKILEHEETAYIVSIGGLPAAVARGNLESLKESAKRQTSLSAKGKDKLAPAEVQITQRDRLADAVFIFPKTQPFVLDDKEVEFSTRIGTASVRYRFRLKDMVFNGKLEL